VSWDHDEMGMKAYSSDNDMNWLALHHRERHAANLLTMKFDVRGIPALYILGEVFPSRL